MRLFLALALFASVSFAGEQAPASSTVQLVNQFLEEVIAPAKDEIVTELYLQLDEKETDFEAPGLKIDGAMKFEKAFWAPRTGARVSASLSAKGEVSKDDPTKATSRLSAKLALETRTLPLVRFSASRFYEEACSDESTAKDSEKKARDLICDALTELEAVRDITHFAQVVTPVIDGLMELVKEEAPELAAGMTYGLVTKGEGKGAEFVWATQYVRPANGELDWLRSGSVVLKLSETGTSVELVLDVDHPAEYLEQARDILKAYSEEVAKVTEAEKEELRASVRKVVEEAKGTVVGGKLETANSLLGFWFSALR